jgi:hypothetical protein
VCVLTEESFAIAEQDWHLVAFKFKPDDVLDAPRQVAPFFHMPRLDWLLWFLALSLSRQPSLDPVLRNQTRSPKKNQYVPDEVLRSLPKWFWHLLLAVCDGEPAVLQLLDQRSAQHIQQTLTQLQSSVDLRKRHHVSADLAADNKSLGEELFVRVQFFEYTFAPDPATVSHGPRQYWTAQWLGDILPVTSCAALVGLYDAHCETALLRHKHVAPSVESAQQVILRTLFRNASKPKQQ